ncbi:hypothetical protein CEXT_227561 [Caerostris extrusa]|uniref:Uncharacterized protein n=1 Tax=Caerostris extrusa TaxID=172846 RepID=A0AAV4WQN6_CAEEX|nr:hypothetical protein CEXT_227561 [Caerostris extrusa]
MYHGRKVVQGVDSNSDGRRHAQQRCSPATEHCPDLICLLIILFPKGPFLHIGLMSVFYNGNYGRRLLNLEWTRDFWMKSAFGVAMMDGDGLVAFFCPVRNGWFCLE